jgi:hypothetical protein
MLRCPERDAHLPRIRRVLRPGTYLPPRLTLDMDYPANCRVLVLSASPDISGSLIRRVFEFEFECVTVAWLIGLVSRHSRD